MGADAATEPTPGSASGSGSAAVRCAMLARALDEPLAGTAPVAERWLCVEQRGAWPRDVAAHTDPAVQTLARRAEDAGWRMLLIRRPGRRLEQRRPDARPIRIVLADTRLDHPRISSLTCAAGDLGRLPLPADDAPLPGAPVTEPLLLVCTHGRRDRCCALDGRALLAAVTAGCPEIAPHVWESSHLGGHRFAPTALVLPTGYLYGRLDPAAAIDVHKAAAHGEMEPLLCRGRSTWLPEGQIAELAVRRATGLREAAALRVEPQSGNDVLVTAADGRRWLVAVEHVTPTGRRPTTCGADPAPITALQVGEVRAMAAF